MGILGRYLLLGGTTGRALLFASGPAATVAEAHCAVIPGAATGQHRAQPSFSGGSGSSLLYLPKTRKRGAAAGAIGTASCEAIPGVACGQARAVGAMAVRAASTALPSVSGRASAVGVVAEGPLKYWLASKWSPEYLAKLREQDDEMLAAIL